MDIDALLARVDPDRLTKRLIDLVSIPSATGFETEMGDFMAGQLRGLGLEVSLLEVEEGRRNVVGRLDGTGRGPSLMFNGHMDTSYSGAEPHLAGIPGFRPEGFEEDGYVFGLGAGNMKGALAAYLETLEVLREAGVKLEGELMIAAVVGEIEKTQWSEEFNGRQYRGYATGSRDLVAHGGVTDYCILGEPTMHKVVLAHFGSMWARISTGGPFIHTAFTRDRGEENSIVRMQELLARVREWIPTWEAEMTHDGVPAIVNLGAIQGGKAWRTSRTPHRTDLFLDLRVPPGVAMAKARARFFEFVRRMQAELPQSEVSGEVYLTAPGADIEESDPLIAAVDHGHQLVFGEAPERDIVHWFSDASALTRYGITSVNYGTASGLPSATKGENVEVKSLADATRVYVAAATQLCGVAA
jgi:acetylornithine deacetylase